MIWLTLVHYMSVHFPSFQFNIGKSGIESQGSVFSWLGLILLPLPLISLSLICLSLARALDQLSTSQSESDSVSIHIILVFYENLDL